MHSPPRSTRSMRSAPSSNSTAPSQQSAFRIPSTDSDRYATNANSKQMFRGSSPQPGPSRRFLRKNTSNDTSRQNSTNAGRRKSGELNLSESDSDDESGPTPMDTHENDNNHPMPESTVSEFDESIIGPHSFNFNADTPLPAFAETITEGIRKRASTSSTQSGKFTDAEIPKNKADLRREYSNLIEKCQGFEDKDADLQELLSENIVRGTQLFKAIGGGPGDMYMAFLHTKMCSGMLKHTVDMIGNSSSVFKREAFIEGVKTFSLQGSENRYSPRAAVAAISLVASECCVAMPHMVAMVGACDRDRIEAPPKQKKPRAAPKRKIFDTNSAKATQHEELNAKVGQRNEPKKTRAELVSQEIAKVLKKRHSETGRASQLFDFTLTKASLAETVEHIFYVGFLVRDGLAALGHQSRLQKEKKLANLMIMPTKPPEKPPTATAVDTNASANRAGQSKNKGKTDERARNQFILSFSPKMFNAMVKSSRGEDFLRLFQQGNVPNPKPKPK